MAVAILINTSASKILPKIESFILLLHILGFFAVCIPLVHVGTCCDQCLSLMTNWEQLAPEKVSAHDVFTVFENGGGWPTTTVSVFVGLLGSVFATYGNESAHSVFMIL